MGIINEFLDKRHPEFEGKLQRLSPGAQAGVSTHLRGSGLGVQTEFVPFDREAHEADLETARQRGLEAVRRSVELDLQPEGLSRAA